MHVDNEDIRPSHLTYSATKLIMTWSHVRHGLDHDVPIQSIGNLIHFCLLWQIQVLQSNHQ